MDISIIIPTYNESENLPILFDRITKVLKEAGLEGEIIVVDDDSPDKTWKIAQGLSNTHGNVKVIRRRGRRGLSSAVIEGFAGSESPVLGVMDADLSHPPEKIPELVEPIMHGGADITIGSRYIELGEIEDWPFIRKLSSKLATIAASKLTSVKDPLSGFIFLRRDVIKSAELNPKGFKIGLEILVKGDYENVIEVPIRFKDRLYGETKLSQNVIIDYLVHVARLYKYKYF